MSVLPWALSAWSCCWKPCLEDLVEQAARVKASPSYAKWDKLREVLDSDDELLRDKSGQRRKVIIFTVAQGHPERPDRSAPCAPWP